METTPQLPPSDKASWPGMMTPAPDLLKWLNTQKPADNVGKRAVVTLRWLVHAELERSVPDPPQSLTHFTPDEPVQTL